MGKIIRNGIEFSSTVDTANNISYDNSLSGLEATTTQKAIDEVAEGLSVKYNAEDDYIYINGVKWKKARLNNVYFIDNFDTADWTIVGDQANYITSNGTILTTFSVFGNTAPTATMQYKEITLLNSPYININGTLKMWIGSSVSSLRESKVTLQISIDNGNTWNDLFSEEISISNGSSVSKAISKNLSLSNYANKKALIRFKFDYLSTQGSGWVIEFNMDNFVLEQ